MQGSLRWYLVVICHYQSCMRSSPCKPYYLPTVLLSRFLTKYIQYLNSYIFAARRCSKVQLAAPSHGRTCKHCTYSLFSTHTSVVLISPRANSSYEGQRLRVQMEFSGPVDDDKSNTLYFEYTGNPNVSNMLPSKQLATSVH